MSNISEFPKPAPSCEPNEAADAEHPGITEEAFTCPKLRKTARSLRRYIDRRRQQRASDPALAKLDADFTQIFKSSQS